MPKGKSLYEIYVYQITNYKLPLSRKILLFVTHMCLRFFSSDYRNGVRAGRNVK